MASTQPRLHVFLGAGGVGKTTLSAGFALALARSGCSVGLLSIDPARRLTTALGMTGLAERGSVVQDAEAAAKGGRLVAAFLNVNESFQRWVEQEGMSADARTRLFENKLFRALVEKFATATDTFAAVRVAEWAEQETFDHLVVDTAPGLHAVDFLSKPDKLLAFLDGKLVEWIKWFVGADKEKRTLIHRMVKSSAKVVLDGLAQVGGRNFLLNFGEFLILLDDVFDSMLKRLQVSVSWMQSERSSFYLVSAVREDAVYVARKLAEEMDRLSLEGRYAIVNRSIPAELLGDAGFRTLLDECLARPPANEEEARRQPFLNYLMSTVHLQRRVEAEMQATTPRVLSIPLAAQLDGTESIRIDDLVGLGNRILRQWG